MNNYAEQILDLLNQEKKDWDLIVRLANQAKMSESQELVFNLHSGYLNYLEGDYSSQLANFFEESGAIVKWCQNQPQLNKLIKNDEISLDKVKNNIYILFAGKSTILEKLTRLEYPINYYTCKVKNKWVKQKNGSSNIISTCDLNHISSNTAHKFELNEQLFKSLSRDLQIKSIFDDKEL